MRTAGPTVAAFVGPVASVAAVSVALCLLAVAPLGWRLGWWPYSFGVYRLFPAAGVMAAIAAAISLATLALVWSRLGRRPLAVLLAVLAVGSGILYLPLRYAYLSRTLPAINDIATDTRNRPVFDATVAARAAESPDRRDTPEPRLSRLQEAGYPDVQPVRTALPVHEAFSAALVVAQTRMAWTIVAADRDKGRIEACARSRWFGFTDDIVIRVSADHGGSRIDMRSASRKGRSDYGANAARIRAYMGDLTKAIGR